MSWLDSKRNKGFNSLQKALQQLVAIFFDQIIYSILPQYLRPHTSAGPHFVLAVIATMGGGSASCWRLSQIALIPFNTGI